MLALLPLLLGSAAPAVPADGPWLMELDAARNVAQESGRDLLVDFTGSDWCSWCKKLDAEVFRESLFTEAASKQYVLVKLDLPHTATALSKVPNIVRNRELATEHRVRNYPTILLMTADGQAYARTGYKAGGAAAYWIHLQELRKEFRAPHVAALEMLASFDTADAASRAQLATAAVALIPKLPPASALIPKLVPIAGHVATLDPDNERGDWARALRVLLPSGYATAEQITAGHKLDPQNKAHLRELAWLAEAYAIKNERDKRRVAKGILELDQWGPINHPQAAIVLYGNGAVWVDTVLRDTPSAKALARKAMPLLKERPRLQNQVRTILRK